MNVSLLEPGSANFNNLNDMTMILVSPFDIFGYGLYRYIFEEQCLEIPNLKLNDGARRIFINANGNNSENFTKEFLDFMKYIIEPSDTVISESGSEKIKRIHDRVCEIKQSEKIGVKLMQAWEEKFYWKQEAQLQLLKELIHDGIISISEAANRLKMSVEELNISLHYNAGAPN